MTVRPHTRTIRAVEDALGSLGRALSAQELHRQCVDHGQPVGLASIYRALDHLVHNGQAERIRRGAEDVYVLCPPAHHHHAICRQCGRVDVTDACTFVPPEPESTGQGFHIDTHQAVYYGRCSDCYAQAPPGRDQV